MERCASLLRQACGRNSPTIFETLVDVHDGKPIASSQYRLFVSIFVILFHLGMIKDAPGVFKNR